MIGQTFNVRIVSVSNEAVDVTLPDGTPAVLPVSELVGKTRAQRQEALDACRLQIGSELVCEVTAVRELDGKTETEVSRYAVVRKERIAEFAALRQLGEALSRSGPFTAKVTRVDVERGFVIIDLGNGRGGMLHVSAMVGGNAALAATSIGDSKHVEFAQTNERRGRVRIDLLETQPQ